MLECAKLDIYSALRDRAKSMAESQIVHAPANIMNLRDPQ